MGHFAFPCFPLAKALKKSPVQIAGEIKELIGDHPLIAEIISQGPYLNFRLNLAQVAEKTINHIIDGSTFNGPLVETPQKVMIEYSQPNTHKVLHVGHMRNLCLGNALVRLLRYTGEDVLAVTYPGDVGTHVAKCLWFLKHHLNEEYPSSHQGAWLGQIYTKANALLEDQLGTSKEEQNRSELTAILKELESGQGEYFDLWQETRKWSLELMQESYDWADVEFDRWFFESEVDAPSLTFAHELYKAGKLIKDQGAIGMDLSPEKLGFCLLVKSDGTGLYATKDVELAKVKFEEFGVQRNIYVVDDRQAYHFKQVFKVLEKIGFEQAKDCYHLPYAMVELKDGAMSSRKGNIIPLMDLVAQMENAIKERYLKRYLEEETEGWSLELVDHTAKIIANGAIKYGMCRMDNNRKIVFDMDEWLKLDGETGPYLQYVHARIFSLVQKIKIDESQVNFSQLTTPQEEALLIKLTQFNEVVVQSATQMKTINLCSYLYELGKLFNSFYAECSIAKAENETLKANRYQLALACGKVMKEGLALLGIEAPEKM